jgi:hypothetical protein
MVPKTKFCMIKKIPRFREEEKLTNDDLTRVVKSSWWWPVLYGFLFASELSAARVLVPCLRQPKLLRCEIK